MKSSFLPALALSALCFGACTGIETAGKATDVVKNDASGVLFDTGTTVSPGFPEDSFSAEDLSVSDVSSPLDTPPHADTFTRVDAPSRADSTPAPQPVDFVSLAKQVDQTELIRTIVDLENFGSRYTFGNGDDQARAYLEARIKAYGHTPELDPFMVGAEEAQNIIVKKPGVLTPEVVYIISAHYDSTSSSPMSSTRGADDNASGVAAVLEALRILSPQPFTHSLWFVFTAAEEQGSVGSMHMAKWLNDKAITVKGVIAPEMIGYWPLKDNDFLDILGDEASQDLVDEMVQVADALMVPYKVFINHMYCYGDDHTSFQEAGIPAISPMDCVDAHNLPVSSGETTPHYHMPTDTFDTLYMPFTARVTGVLVGTFAKLGDLTGQACAR